MADLRALLEMREASPLQFSDDGASLLVGSNIPGTQQLYELPSRGGELRQLTDYAEPVSGQLLPDGRILLERDEGGNERTQLYLLGGDLEPLVVDARFIHATPHERGHVGDQRGHEVAGQCLAGWGAWGGRGATGGGRAGGGGGRARGAPGAGESGGAVPRAVGGGGRGPVVAGKAGTWARIVGL